MKKDTTFIYYLGGAYGTFIEWCLNYFTDESTLPLILSESGSAHKYDGYLLVFPPQFENYCKGFLNVNFARLHPGSTSIERKDLLLQPGNTKEIFFKELEILSDISDQTIVLYFCDTNLIWGVQNQLTKTNLLEDYNEEVVERWCAAVNQNPTYCTGGLVEKLYGLANNHWGYSNWGVQTVADLDLWQLREFLSIDLPSKYSDWNKELFDVATETFTNMKFVNIDQFRDNFKETIIDLITYSKKSVIREEEIEFVYSEWINKQYHIHKDFEVATIVDAIKNQQYYDWSDKNLNLLDEIFLQHFLRNADIEIRCYNLNKLPTNTKDFEKFLIRN